MYALTCNFFRCMHLCMHFSMVKSQNVFIDVCCDIFIVVSVHLLDQFLEFFWNDLFFSLMFCLCSLCIHCFIQHTDLCIHLFFFT